MRNMLIPILAVVILLVGWALHLMEQAIDRREFSLMLAGTLVASAAAALVAVYCLMGNYVGYVTGVSPYAPTDKLSANVASDSVDWILDIQGLDPETPQSQMAANFQP
jgi:hypothetical protein